MRRTRERRDGVRPTIGVVVEGRTEYEAFKLLRQTSDLAWPPMKLVSLQGVGADQTMAAIAGRVCPKIVQLRLQGCARVVVCLDREDREACTPRLAADLSAALRRELRSVGKAEEGVSVVLADRAFEAWLIAGAAELHANGKLAHPWNGGPFDGRSGSGGKKGTVELDRLLGREYQKTTDGPRLFAAMDFAAARGRSRSLHKWVREILDGS